MAKTKISKPAKAEWKGFHNVNLTKENEVAFLEFRNSEISWDKWLTYFVDNGYKVSFDYDPYNQGFKAALYCTEKKMEWAGYTMTAWAADITTAFYLIIFKHDVMCEGRWEVAKDVTNKGTSSFG